MFETPLTIVGNIVNDPVRRPAGEHEVVTFRVASNSRHRAADGTWEHGHSLFVNVNCWGRLITGVLASLRKGSPVIVTGHARTRDYEDRDGVRRSVLDLKATAVGPDLARCIAQLERVVPLGADPAADAPEPAESQPDDLDDDSGEPVDLAVSA